NRRQGENVRKAASERRKIWSKGLPEAVKPLKSDHPMVAGKYGYYWECDDGTVSMDLEAIWGMSVKY
ncbi:MAG: hypothetical protein QGH01_15680, partial [Alphaproteobacteria bacterium]|nr:hypothetical protein [Alphaproteobacteria bacterium]